VKKMRWDSILPSGLIINTLPIRGTIRSSNPISASGNSVADAGRLPINEMNQAGYRVHVFEGAGTYTWTVNSGFGPVEYMVVAGGGGGGGCGSGGAGGGGGAGGAKVGRVYVVPGDYTVTVGAGGAGGSTTSRGTNGSNSSVFDVTVTGGGAGGGTASGQENGNSGGSGGGSGIGAAAGTGGAGISGEGFAGGPGAFSGSRIGGGGGGATTAGLSGFDYGIGGFNGGFGWSPQITTLARQLTNIEAGSYDRSYANGGSGGVAGLTGDGAAGANPGDGGEGGGGRDSLARTGGAGRGGIVVIRYKIG
jgi:hypothetical protein